MQNTVTLSAQLVILGQIGLAGLPQWKAREMRRTSRIFFGPC